jgi:hypothetical protein
VFTSQTLDLQLANGEMGRSLEKERRSESPYASMVSLSIILESNLSEFRGLFLLFCTRELKLANRKRGRDLKKGVPIGSLYVQPWSVVLFGTHSFICGLVGS